MANLPTPRVTTITAYSQYVYHFEIDADNMRIKVSGYDRDNDLNMIEGSAKTGSWIELFDSGGMPNLPQEHWALVADVMPKLTLLAVEYGKVSGVIDNDATV